MEKRIYYGGFKMADKILMPASGQTAAESLIVKWLVSEGDVISRGDVLFEIETDKATMNVESYAKGTLLKICYQEGESVEAGKVVAYIGAKGEQTGEEPPSVLLENMEEEYRPILVKHERVCTAQDEEQEEGAIMASPAARRLAKERGIDLLDLYAKEGKTIKRADIMNIVKNEEEYETRIPSPMRRTIARRMMESIQEAPQFTISIRADMSAFISFRKQLNAMAEDGVKLSFNDILIKCVCKAIQKVPYINALYTEEEIRLYKHMNIGIAVALEDGLVVPVVRGANTLSLSEVARESKRLIDSAKEGNLRAEEMQGGTFTISNLGMYGIDRFTALVNRPESAIIAVGAVVDTPAARNGEVQIRPMMDITASFDHRMIDGGVGARFMAELRKFIEEPAGICL